ncbi:hypothetical protein RB598_005302 [Gaeumannomyces tritici]
MTTASLEPYVIVGSEDDDAGIQEILKRSSLRARDKPSPEDSVSKRKKGAVKFTGPDFTRTYSTFDRNNEATANSPFHGFFTLFWMAVFLAMVKMAVENWKAYGSPLGRNEIMSSMFRRDVAVLLAADAMMCALTGVCWLLQRAVLAGHLSWDRSGWIIQNVWQMLFIAGVVGLTLVRDWPWSHTVFFVMHGIVMLMKQHSYAFYNGHLSTAYKNRADLISRLGWLAKTAPARSPSNTQPPATAVSTSHLASAPSAHNLMKRRSSLTPRPSEIVTDRPSTGEDKRGECDIDRIAEAIKNKEPMDADQIAVFEKVLRWEVDALTEELKGKATAPERAYPNNLTLWNQCEYNLLPTLVYELEYPRSHSVSWAYVAEKIAATVGIIFAMIMISQSSIWVTHGGAETDAHTIRRSSRYEDNRDEGDRGSAARAVPVLSLDVERAVIPLYARVPLGLVPDLGDHSEWPWRGMSLCRQELLRRVVEQRFVGSVCPRLEPAGTQLPIAACLSQFHFSFEGQQAHGNLHNLLPVRPGP